MVYFRDVNKTVWHYDGKELRIDKYVENAIQIYTIGFHNFILNADRKFNGENVTKIVKYLDKLLCLNSRNMILSMTKKGYIIVMKKVVDFWVNENILLVKFRRNKYRVYNYDNQQNNLVKISMNIIQEHNGKDVIGFLTDFTENRLTILYKLYEQQITLVKGNTYRSVHESSGILYINNVRYDTEFPVRYIRNSNDNIILFLENCSLYIVEFPYDIIKITDSLSYPLDHVFESNVKSARKIIN